MDKQKIRQIITQRQQDIVAINAQSGVGQQTVELDQTRVGRLSRIDAMQAQQMNKAGQRRRDSEMQRLTQALARLENADYGECEECAEQISVGRLELDPAATLCIKCASKLEES